MPNYYFFYFFVVLSFASAEAKVRTVTLDMALKVDNQLVERPKKSIGFGQTATVEYTPPGKEPIFIDVTPSWPVKGRIKMKMKIGKLISGKKTTLTRPEFETVTGQGRELIHIANDVALGISIVPNIN